MAVTEWGVRSTRMEITETLYVSQRKDWRAWLRANHKTKKEIWLIFYKKGSGKPRIAYNDAVEEALCFGWIDSTVKKMDADCFAQRFSPRNPRSGYSRPNIERLRKLVRQGKVIKAVRDKVAPLLADDAWEAPADILAETRNSPQAWKNYEKFPDGYKRIRISYIDSARPRPDEFRKRLNYFLRMTEKNKQFGYVKAEDIMSRE